MAKGMPILKATRRSRNEEISVHDLRFMPENPRIYTESRGDRSQSAIEGMLQSRDYVKSLKRDIERHGGVMEPLIVVDEGKLVLDGNGRLAALRLLFHTDKDDRWKSASCIVIEDDLSEKEVFSILCQKHIKGQTKWESYEQANLFYVNHKKNDLSIDDLASGSGLGVPTVRKLIGTIEEMAQNNDAERRHWSYYKELLTNRSIRQGCDSKIGLKKRLLQIIKEGDEDTSAQDFRNKVPEILKGPPRNLKQFIEGKKGLHEAHAIADGAGKLTERVKRFRAWLGETNTPEQLNKFPTVERNGFAQQLGRLRKEIDDGLKTMKNLK